MKSSEIRKKFQDFFRHKGHKVLPGSSLIPEDPSVLFTLAGMLQFKPYFLGAKKAPAARAATVQKCLRMVDIENVGRTGRHHTFFEMLGNFSFGDYFKKEAIEFAWELLTGVFNIDKEKLSAAVFEKDDEAADIWLKVIGLPKEKLFRLGEDNNFWSAGPTGPCGPCSEIYFDLGPDKGCGRPGCAPGCDCERFLEVWNLVFIEFNRDDAGKLSPLSQKGIDTGMGLERIASVLQGVASNFETDLFEPIIKAVISGTKEKHVEARPVRIVADHIRAATHLIADGVFPSNEGRGYVLRRIIRRAVRHAGVLKLPSPFLDKLSHAVIEEGKSTHPDLKRKEKDIKNALVLEEKAFVQTLGSGEKMLQELLGKFRSVQRLPGKEAFMLHDTFGFPIDITKEIAAESGFSVDEEGFAAEMEAQRERARAAGISAKEKISFDVHSLKLKPSKFLGYETLISDSKVTKIIPSDNVVCLDRTPFYPEGGGQVGDKGSFELSGKEFPVLAAVGEIDGVIAHIVDDTSVFKEGAQVKAAVNASMRHSTEKHHTSTHLLHKALRMVLGEDVKQAGSFVSPERLRFDYSVKNAPRESQLFEIEKIVNEKIKQNLKVAARTMGLDEAKKLGATALFDEKYSDKVRVLEIGGFSMELCGGTHVARTGAIEMFKITSDESISSGIRRIEAVVGDKVIEYVLGRQEALRRENVESLRRLEELERKKQRMGGNPLVDFDIFEITAEELNIIKKALRERDVVSIEKFLDHLEERNGRLLDRIMNIEKEIRKLSLSRADEHVQELLGKAEEICGVRILVSPLKDFDMEALRMMADKTLARLKTAVVLLASEIDGRLIFSMMISDDLVKKGFSAREIMSRVARAAGGGGGGKPEKAEAGAKDASKLAEAMNEGREAVIKKIQESQKNS